MFANLITFRVDLENTVDPLMAMRGQYEQALAKFNTGVKVSDELTMTFSGTPLFTCNAENAAKLEAHYKTPLVVIVWEKLGMESMVDEKEPNLEISQNGNLLFGMVTELTANTKGFHVIGGVENFLLVVRGFFGKEISEVVWNK